MIFDQKKNHFDFNFFHKRNLLILTFILIFLGTSAFIKEQNQYKINQFAYQWATKYKNRVEKSMNVENVQIRMLLEHQFLGSLQNFSIPAHSYKDLQSFFLWFRIPLTEFIFQHNDLFYHHQKVGFFNQNRQRFRVTHPELLKLLEKGLFLRDPFLINIFGEELTLTPKEMKNSAKSRYIQFFLLKDHQIATQHQVIFRAPINQKEQFLVDLSEKILQQSQSFPKLLISSLYLKSHFAKDWAYSLLIYSKDYHEFFVLTTQKLSFLEAIQSFFCYDLLIYMGVFILVASLITLFFMKLQHQKTVSLKVEQSSFDKDTFSREVEVSSFSQKIESSESEHISEEQSFFFQYTQSIPLKSMIFNSYQQPFLLESQNQLIPIFNRILGQKRLVNQDQEEYILFFHLYFEANVFLETNPLAKNLLGKLQEYFNLGFDFIPDSLQLGQHAEILLYAIQKDLILFLTTIDSIHLIEGFVAISPTYSPNTLYFTINAESVDVIEYGRQSQAIPDFIDFSKDPFYSVKIDDFFYVKQPLRIKSFNVLHDIYWGFHLKEETSKTFIQLIDHAVGYFKGLTVEYQMDPYFQKKGAGFHHYKYLLEDMTHSQGSLKIEEICNFHKQKGNESFYKEDYHAAVDHYLEALHFFPQGNEPLLMDLFHCYTILEEYAHLEEIIKKALALNPFNLTIMTHAVSHYKKMKQFDKAYFLAIRLYLLNSSDRANLENICELLTLQDKNEEAQLLKNQLL